MKSLLIALAACLALAPAASDASPGRYIGDAQGGIFSDGERWAGFAMPDGRSTLIDTVAGTREVLDGARYCGDAVPRGLEAIGGGHAVIACIRGQLRSGVILDLGTRRTRPAPGDFWGWYGGVGSNWIELVEAGDNPQPPDYVNWRTGERVSKSGTPRQTLDLNSATLLRPRCRPLRRRHRREIDADEFPFSNLGYDRPYAIDARWVRDSKNRENFNPHLVLERCGRRGAKTLSRSRALAGWRDAQLGAGWVSWGWSASGAPGDAVDALHAYFPKADRRRRFRVRLLNQVVHTRNRLLYGVGHGGHDPLRVYEARVNRRTGAIR